MKAWLVYLYPRAWRQRYGDEFRAVLDQHTLTIADVVDIVRGALDAHWTGMLAAPRNFTRMKRVIAHVMPLVWLAVIMGGCFFVSAVATSPFRPWRFVARPPLPAHATHIQTEYPSRVTGSDEVNRTTTFTTDQPPVVIQQFYRTALPSQGWHYLCTVTPTEPPCGRVSLWPDADELIEVYEPGLHVKHARAVEVKILRPDARGMRAVQIHELVLAAYNILPHSADPTGPPRVALVGQWRATDAASGDNFILRVYQDNRVEVVDESWAGGTYQWDGDTAIRITFTVPQGTRIVGETDDGAYGLCRNAPSFLKDQCEVSVYTPAASPTPASPAPATPATPTPNSITTVTPEPAYPGPPAPTPQPTEAVSSRIDATFTVAVDVDTLTLTNPLGTMQTFRRVDGS